jgi:hypothetical protein
MFVAALVALASCAALLGCGDDDSPAPSGDASTPTERGDASDADVISPPPPPPMDSGQPNFPGLDMDSSFALDDAATPFCALKVAAECDGAEDCGAGVCCATFDPINVTYSAIRCQDSCESLNELVLCHANQPCTADRSVVCHQSLLLGQPTFGVCVPREQPQPPPVGVGVSGEIACGDDSCIVGSEHCCLRTSFSFATLQSMPLQPYCAPLDAPCDCTDGFDDLDAGFEPRTETPNDAGR